MLRTLSIFLLFTISLCANIAQISSDSFRLDTASHQITLEDKNHKLSSQDILNNNFQNYTTLTNSTYSHSIFWTKTIIENTSNKTTTIYFRNLRSGIDFIDVYIFSGQNLIATKTLGDKRDQTTREILSAKSTFSLDLKPSSQVTIVSKYSSMGSMDFTWEILDEQQYHKVNNIENIYYGLFGGIMIALIIYNLSLFVGLKEASFAFYVLQGFCILWFVFATDGVFYMLDLGLNLDFLTTTTWLMPTLMLVFTTSFIKTFFGISKTDKFLHHSLNFSVAISLLFFVVFLYGYLANEKIFVDVSPIYLNISFLIFLVILVASIWAWIQKKDGAIFIVFGEVFYLSSVIYLTFLFAGKITTEPYSHFVLPIGAVLEMLFFSLAISKKINKFKSDLESAKIISMQDEQFVKYGKLIGNIAHQWKQPLAYISAEIMYLLTLKEFDKESQIKDEFLKMAPKINFTIEIMSQTIALFRDFYQADPTKTQINVKSEIQKLLKIYEFKMISINQNIEIICIDDLQIKTFKTSFLQIFITIFDCFLEELEKQKTQEAKIKIECKKQQNNLEITFDSNFHKSSKLDIFKFNSDMQNSKARWTNINLHTIKTVIEEKLGGEIFSSQTKLTPNFTVKIPIE